MKKTLSLMAATLVASTTIATASPSDQMDLTTFNQSDSHMLFGKDTHDIMMLEQDEMRNTEGEWWPIIFALAFGWAAKTPANAPTINGPTYQRWPYQRQTYYYTYF